MEVIYIFLQKTETFILESKFHKMSVYEIWLKNQVRHNLGNQIFERFQNLKTKPSLCI